MVRILLFTACLFLSAWHIKVTEEQQWTNDDETMDGGSTGGQGKECRAKTKPGIHAHLLLLCDLGQVTGPLWLCFLLITGVDRL